MFDRASFFATVRQPSPRKALLTSQSWPAHLTGALATLSERCLASLDFVAAAESRRAGCRRCCSTAQATQRASVSDLLQQPPCRSMSKELKTICLLRRCARLITKYPCAVQETGPQPTAVRRFEARSKIVIKVPLQMETRGALCGQRLDIWRKHCSQICLWVARNRAEDLLDLASSSLE